MTFKEWLEAVREFGRRSRRAVETRVLAVLAFVFVVACLAGVVVSLNLKKVETGSPSAWVPATVTALALAYSLVQQSRNEHQRRVDAERGPNELVHVLVRGIGMSEDVPDQRVVALSIFNLGPVPIYDLRIDVTDSDRNSVFIELGNFGPRATTERRVSTDIPLRVEEPLTYRPEVVTEWNDHRGDLWIRDQMGDLFAPLTVGMGRRNKKRTRELGGRR